MQGSDESNRQVTPAAPVCEDSQGTLPFQPPPGVSTEERGNIVGHFYRGGPKGVSTKGVSVKRPNFPFFRAFYAVVSERNFQRSP